MCNGMIRTKAQDEQHTCVNVVDAALPDGFQLTILLIVSTACVQAQASQAAAASSKIPAAIASAAQRHVLRPASCLHGCDAVQQPSVSGSDKGMPVCVKQAGMSTPQILQKGFNAFVACPSVNFFPREALLVQVVNCGAPHAMVRAAGNAGQLTDLRQQGLHQHELQSVWSTATAEPMVIASSVATSE